MDFPLTRPAFYFLSLVGGAVVGVFCVAARLPVPIASGLGLLFCLGVNLHCTGLEISANKRNYRSYVGLPGLHLGRWQPLPPVVGVTLKYFSSSRERIVVLLSVGGQSQGLVCGRFELDDVNKAIDLAHDTAEAFSVLVTMYLPPHLFQPPSTSTEANDQF